jgi:hypothetical protein
MRLKRKRPATLEELEQHLRTRLFHDGSAASFSVAIISLHLIALTWPVALKLRSWPAKLLLRLQALVLALRLPSLIERLPLILRSAIVLSACIIGCKDGQAKS